LDSPQAIGLMIDCSPGSHKFEPVIGRIRWNIVYNITLGWFFCFHPFEVDQVSAKLMIQDGREVNMFVRRFTAAIFVVSMLFAGLSNSSVRADDSAERAEAFIVKLADQAISQLTDSSLGLDEQERRFKEIVHEYIAFESIARWVLGGRHWRAASEEQRSKYLTLFEELMVATYAHRFQNYAGEKLVVTDTRVIDAGQSLVRTTLMRPNAEKPLRVDWRVRETEGTHRVIDIMVEGLSMAQSQRSEFSSLLRSNGGDIDGLMNELELRLTNARAERSKTVNAGAQKS